MEPQERNALILLLVVIATLIILHFGVTACGKAAFAAPFSPDARDVQPTNTGGHLILMVNGTRIFFPDGADAGTGVMAGSTCTCTGEVQTYRGEREIVIASAGDLIIHTS
jgi:hypothetical protein